MALPPISPTGVATAFLYPRQTMTSASALQWATQFASANPGFTNPPIIFEPPPELTNGELLVWIIATGRSSNWAGCAVYVSVDNTTYAPIGVIGKGGIQGFLSAAFPSGSDPDTTNTLSVDLSLSMSQLIAGTVQDADDFLTLCYCDGELIAYSAAALTGPYAYNLSTYIRRGCYGTLIGSHSLGTQFGRIVATTFSQQFPPNLVGRKLYFKFPSFNQFGTAQDLAEAAVYTYTLTGAGALTAESWYQSFSVGGKFTDLVLDEWDSNYEIFDVQMPATISFGANFAGSPAPGCEVAPGANVTLTFQSITPAGVATTVGTLTINSGQKTGAYTTSGFSVPTGHRLRLYAPASVDTAIVGLYGTICGSRAGFTAQPVITLTPSGVANPDGSIPDTTALGAQIATFAVTMSDGSTFVGTVAFGAPYYDDGGIFLISGSNIYVNASGPGIANSNITSIYQFTLVATQS